jgi:hypothetical protein
VAKWWQTTPLKREGTLLTGVPHRLPKRGGSFLKEGSQHKHGKSLRSLRRGADALFLSAFRFEHVAYGATRNSFAFYGFTPVNDFGAQLISLRA